MVRSTQQKKKLTLRSQLVAEAQEERSNPRYGNSTNGSKYPVLPRIINPDSIIIRMVTETDLVRLEWEGEFKKYRRMYARLYRNMLTGTTLMWLIEDRPGAGNRAGLRDAEKFTEHGSC